MKPLIVKMPYRLDHVTNGSRKSTLYVVLGDWVLLNPSRNHGFLWITDGVEAGTGGTITYELHSTSFFFFDLIVNFFSSRFWCQTFCKQTAYTLRTRSNFQMQINKQNWPVFSSLLALRMKSTIPTKFDGNKRYHNSPADYPLALKPNLKTHGKPCVNDGVESELSVHEPDVTFQWRWDL